MFVLASIVLLILDREGLLCHFIMVDKEWRVSNCVASTGYTSVTAFCSIVYIFERSIVHSCMELDRMVSVRLDVS